MRRQQVKAACSRAVPDERPRGESRRRVRDLTVGHAEQHRVVRGSVESSAKGADDLQEVAAREVAAREVTASRAAERPHKRRAEPSGTHYC